MMASESLPCKPNGTSYDCQLQTCHGLPQCGNCCKCQGHCIIELSTRKPLVEEEVAPGVHTWPTNGDHLWSKWRVFNRTTYYRTCVHPDCNESQHKDVPKA